MSEVFTVIIDGTQDSQGRAPDLAAAVSDMQTAVDNAYQGAEQQAVDAAIGVLVADGASPTQGHVNTLNAAWTAYQAVLQTAADASGAVPGVDEDILVAFNPDTVVTKNRLLNGVRKMLDLICGQGILS